MSAAFFRLPKVVCAQIVGTDHFSFIVIRICIIGFAVCFRIDDLRCVFLFSFVQNRLLLSKGSEYGCSSAADREEFT